MSDADLFIKLLPVILGDPAAARLYNPVVCYGSPIALDSASKWLDRVIAQKHSGAEIVRINGHAFVDCLIQTILENGDITQSTKSRCKGDILILTEPEAFAGKELSGEKLYEILDDCLLRGQPIVAFADTPPFRIPRLMPRIRTQPEGGILLDLGSEPIGSL